MSTSIDGTYAAAGSAFNPATADSIQFRPATGADGLTLPLPGMATTRFRYLVPTGSSATLGCSMFRSRGRHT